MRRCARRRRCRGSRSRAAMSRAKSSQQPVASASGVPAMPSILEWGILVAIELLVVVMVRSAGLRRGLELMPWPDGLEYAASAVNLANGRGAVLHFGGYTYPSRYTGGYPLILKYVTFTGVPPFFISMVLGGASIIGIFLLVRSLLGHAAGVTAALLLAFSPVFITYSSLAMSDVPTLSVTIYAAGMLATATSEGALQSNWLRIWRWLIFGLFAGFSTI